MPLLLQFVDINSTIITDFTQIYKRCEKFGFFTHKSVCHRRYFVCPADKNVYTNNMEVTRRWRKRGVLNCGDENSVERHLAESEFCRRYFYNQDLAPLPLYDKFLLFWHHIKLVYPGPGSVERTFPTVDDGDEDNNSESNIIYSCHNISHELLSNDSMDVPAKKRRNSVPVIKVSDETQSDVDICGSAKQLCRSFIYNGLCFGSPVKFNDLSHSNESTITKMFSLLCSSSPQLECPSSHFCRKRNKKQLQDLNSHLSNI